ncbi:phosphotransferase family protein [Amycolatopsis suaedae]|uniref:Aminoglycoside phosphotransferase family protein n=1 Tax=Amycolatopsis suaedae TaxID=2510978 RepID=A0A4Q7JA64_9PSEU|nr:aminoglycoside 3'-phosphotransferase/choline kinase family protein [Amycolatopsis suaedae]RZQ64690.1 aminoglycoside phosphotransferase family protein [Amycolatopsis suaedae]
MGLLPYADTPEEFESLRAEQLEPGVAAILGHTGFTRFPEGSLPVYAVGDDLVLKLYPPPFHDELSTESSALRAVEGKLPVPTPAVVRTGTLEGWGHLLMSRLSGVSLTEAWPRLTDADRADVATQLGSALAALHQVPAPSLEPPDWAEFLTRQRESAVDRQRRAGLAEEWLDQIPGFLDGVDLGDPAPVLLHTEVMRDHVLVERAGDRWRLSGLFDFEPAMRGAAEYEFAAVGLFTAMGDPAFLRGLLLSYGYSPGELDHDFSRRCLAYTLLHVYSNLKWYLKILPAPAEPTLDALATAWFSAAESTPAG